MKLLEIISGEETLPELLDFMATFGEKRLGKGIVWAKDTPNFVGNRIGVQGMVSAIRQMLEDGLTIPEVELFSGPPWADPKRPCLRRPIWSVSIPLCTLPKTLTIWCPMTKNGMIL